MTKPLCLDRLRTKIIKTKPSIFSKIVAKVVIQKCIILFKYLLYY
jgi:hypothetical protein